MLNNENGLGKRWGLAPMDFISRSLMYIGTDLFLDGQNLYIEAGLWQRPMRKVPMYILIWENLLHND